MPKATPRMRAGVTLLALLALTGLVTVTARAQTPPETALPPKFTEQILASGISEPTAVRFASDGRMFVAEKRGVVRVFPSPDAPLSQSTVFADLRTAVYNHWDRGLLGLALDPSFPAKPYVYVSYTLDALPGGTAPKWGRAGADTDPCPNPPGSTGDGCVVTGRISRLQAAGNRMAGAEKVLVQDFCQQYPSHSVGGLVFGSDGALYTSAGDGASFNWADWGQDGSPVNPCGDPPGRAGSALAPPTAEGGALRSQDLRTPGDPTSLDGAILRINPATGLAGTQNPLAASPDPNARRIVAYGLRNPFRFTVRPGTADLWIGDVGMRGWEELNRAPTPTARVENFGWPCYEGPNRQPLYDEAELTMCEQLYAERGAVTNPYLAWRQSDHMAPDDQCGTGGSSISGLAFQSGGQWPPDLAGALFVADYTRKCIWAVPKGANGLPDISRRAAFAVAAPTPVDVQSGPGGDLYYVSLSSPSGTGATVGSIRRIRPAPTQPPRPVVTVTPPNGAAPLTVRLDASRSTDPENAGPLLFAWDLDNDGAFDDGTTAAVNRTFTAPGNYRVRVRITDADGGTAVGNVTVPVGNDAPVPTITTPAAGARWSVGDRISVTGKATDRQQGELPGTALAWTVVLEHCTSGTSCHEHVIDRFTGTSGAIDAPDHEYPSHLELRLTATDAQGAETTVTRELQPRTAEVTVRSEPAGLDLVVSGTRQEAPFTTTVLDKGTATVSAPAQEHDGKLYAFTGWSDGGAASHNVTAPATLTATFKPATGLRISARPATVVTGADVTVAGRLVAGEVTSSDGVGGQTLTFLARPAGSTAAWQTIGTATTAGDGLAALTHRPGANVEYTVRFAGSGGWAPSASPAARVSVRTAVTTTISPSRVRVNAPATISGRVTPAHGGQTVQLQRLVGTSWRASQNARLSGSGTYSFTVRRTETGTTSWRVVKAADADHAAGTGPTVKLTTVS